MLSQYDINIWTWLSLFVIYLLFDILYVKYIQAVGNANAFRSANISVLMYLLTAYGTIEYISNFVNVIPIILGSWIGNYVTLKFGRRNSEKKGKGG